MNAFRWTKRVYDAAANLLADYQPVTGRKITLTYKDAYIVPQDVDEIRVLGGAAWVSYKGEDFILYLGQKMMIDARRRTVIVTALGRKSLTLELRP